MAAVEKMYTVDEVAELTSLTSRTIRNYLRSGALKGRKIGGQWRFTEHDIEALLGSRRANEDMNRVQAGRISEFLDGAGSRKYGDVSVCSVIDLYLPQQEVAEKCEKICSLFTVESDTELSFRYEYDSGRGRGRIVIFATPALTGEVMRLLCGD